MGSKRIFVTIRIIYDLLMNIPGCICEYFGVLDGAVGQCFLLLAGMALAIMAAMLLFQLSVFLCTFMPRLTFLLVFTVYIRFANKY